MPLDDTTGFLKAPAKLKPEAKSDVFSVTGLRDWLRTMPPRGTYNWHDCRGGCLIGLYALAHGYEAQTWDKVHTWFFHRERALSIASRTPHTFGAALNRAEAWLAKHPEEQ